MFKRLLPAFLMLYSCGRTPSNDSEIAISNGVAIASSVFPEAVLIVAANGINPVLHPNKIDFSKPEPDASACTGIHVGKNLVLTSAGCTLCPNEKKLFQRKCKPEELSVYNRAVERVTYHPKVTELNSEKYPVHDLALLHLKNSLPLPYAKFCEHAPKKGNRVIMLGYGTDESKRESEMHNNFMFNFRRLGNNKIDRISSDSIFVTANEKKSSKDPLGEDTWFTDGDQGGPLFYGKCVVGVASIVTLPNLLNETIVENFYVNLLNPENRNFITENL